MTKRISPELPCEVNNRRLLEIRMAQFLRVSVQLTKLNSVSPTARA